MVEALPLTVAGALQAAQRAGVDRLDAHLLLAHVLGQRRTWLLTHDDEPLNPAQDEWWRSALARRAAGEPLAYLLGAKDFFGLTLQVGPSVLIPRPDTETLVAWAIEILQPRTAAAPSPFVLDLGTGSGAIALALKRSRSDARVVATDKSEAALALARANGHRLGLAVEWRLGDWWVPAEHDRFDLVLSNPPYIAADDPHLEALRHEPAAALVSGADGLSALRLIIAAAPSHLLSNAWLIVEHGYEQAPAVRTLFNSAGFEGVSTRTDLAGQPRCTGGLWRPHRAAVKSRHKA